MIFPDGLNPEGSLVTINAMQEIFVSDAEEVVDTMNNIID